MRELTFKGFLTQYVKKLSYANTLDMAVLAKEAATDNYRLRAPLVLYAIMCGKAGLLRTNLIAGNDDVELLRILSQLDCGNTIGMLENGKLPEDYQKVWNSFQVRRDRPKHEEELKASMREAILQMQREKNFSNYRLYKDLNLNPGNINSWLKNGDGTKVSYRTAERIITYVMQC